MKMNASNNLSVILASFLIVALWHNSFVLAIRTPYFSTGKFAERDVDTGIWSTSQTLSNIISGGHCAIRCVNSNTATAEWYYDDVCSGYEYNSATKTCKLGKTNLSLSESQTTKKVMHKYVEPWLEPVTTGMYQCDANKTCCGNTTRGLLTIGPAGDCCTDSNPCEVGEGGCTSDSQCKDDLVCGAECNPFVQGNGTNCGDFPGYVYDSSGISVSEIAALHSYNGYSVSSYSLCRSSCQTNSPDFDFYKYYYNGHHYCYCYKLNAGDAIKLTSSHSYYTFGYATSCATNCCMKPIHKCRGRFATADCCSSTNKCEEGEGDCDSDSDCHDGLKCGTKNCDYSLGYHYSYDCCYKATESSPTTTATTTTTTTTTMEQPTTGGGGFG